MSIKKITIFIALFQITLSLQAAPELGAMLQRGDSLFKAKQYTKAFAVYEQITSQAEAFSPSMLLKMAFVKEGLEEYPEALYYLSLLYRKTKDEEVRQQITRLAQEHELEGYDWDDRIFFLALLDRIKFQMAALSLGVCAVLSGAAIWLNRPGKRKTGLLTAAVLLTLGFLVIFNLDYRRDMGIIRRQALIMRAPSAAGGQLTTIDQGHKVEIIGQTDIWYQIRWAGQKGYIRADHILSL